MKPDPAIKEGDISTEEKIKTAAKVIFQERGFAATRTRDIAEKAGINLALLNYYFRSKKKLFDMIMIESLQGFIRSMSVAFNDESTSFEAKIELLVSNYIDLLIAEPNVPLFVLSELRANPEEFVSKVKVKELIMDSHFIKQFNEEAQKGKMITVNPLHFVVNMAGMIIFPFIAIPVLTNVHQMKHEEFVTLMEERKALIPIWLKTMMIAT